MSRDPFETLTEQMFYTLLALDQPRCGVEIMERVGEITQGRLHLGPGTLYALLARFEKTGLIREQWAEGRKRIYECTEKGCRALDAETQRLRLMLTDHDRLSRREG